MQIRREMVRLLPKYQQPNIQERWAGCLIGIVEVRGSFTFLKAKPTNQRSLARSKSRWVIYLISTMLKVILLQNIIFFFYSIYRDLRVFKLFSKPYIGTRTEFKDLPLPVVNRIQVLSPNTTQDRTWKKHTETQIHPVRTYRAIANHQRIIPGRFKNRIRNLLIRIPRRCY